MEEENESQEFRLKNIDETRNYLIEEINRNELKSKKHKKICTTLNYIEHFLILFYFLSIIKKKKKHNKIVLLAKSKLNSIEVLISKALIDSNISQDEFILLDVLKQYDEMKEEIKNLKT